MFRTLRHALLRLARDRTGNVAVVAALSLPVVLGAFGIGAEAASWIATKRALQNAADAAAIAAATNAGATYADEAKAVADQYGFKDGAGGVTVAASDTAPCPASAVAAMGGSAGAPRCFSVTVTRTQPVLLAQVVGYKGDELVNGAPTKLVSATAVAIQGDTTRPYCLLALGTSGGGPAIRTNGAPNANLSGCNLMSDNGATCNGHNLKADVGDAYGTNDGCGVVQNSNVKKLPDPYEDLADNIPPNPCTSKYPTNTYPQDTAARGAAKKTTTSPLHPENLLSGNLSSGGTVALCGDVKLLGDTTITQDTTLVIYNGDLNTNGNTLQTAAGTGATVIFAGDNSSTYTHVPTGGGTLDIAAPTSGPWQGVAVYQDPALTNGVNISAAGNSPTWDITGIAYLPHSSVTFSGAVNKASNGKSCFGLVVDNILVNGTGSILAHGQCDQAKVTLPTAQVPGRGKLVQ